MSGPTVDVVVPTVGRPSLAVLLAALGRGEGPRPDAVWLVDDRPGGGELPMAAAGPLVGRVRVLRGRADGPAAARNLGWRASSADWVAFLDDDVLPDPDWPARLADDLRAAGPDVGAVQGRLRVPLPAHRRPTDWERDVGGLSRARYATADTAYRRTALTEVGGFDERFPRAYREDADLALRVLARGWRIHAGIRVVSHPVLPADPWVSVRRQAGNADDVLMAALHGRGWRARAQAAPGRRSRHLATTAGGLAALGALAGGRRRAAALLGLGWLWGTAEFAWARIAPGPRTPAEVATMLLTSAAIPPAATLGWMRGLMGRRRLLADRERAPRPAGRRPAAVLFDRDGTLAVDVPYNGNPARVEPMPGALSALARLRAAGVPTAIVTNQSGIARGTLTLEQVRAVNRRLEELLGPLGPVLICPHGPDDGCGCRKPAPGLVLEAARALGVDPGRCAMVGDIGADVEAARAAGARPILVPTPRTRPEEVAAAPEVAPDLVSAVDRLLAGGRGA